MNITPLHDSILFSFEEEVNKVGFNQQSASGIVYKSFDFDTKTPRWGIALKVGPSVKVVKEGDRILIDSLRWTEGHEIEGVKFWRTTEGDVIGVSTTD